MKKFIKYSNKEENERKTIISFSKNKVDENLVLENLSTLLLNVLNKKNNEINDNSSIEKKAKTQSISGEIIGKNKTY